jgi:hypothetical protein
LDCLCDISILLVSISQVDQALGRELFEPRSLQEGLSGLGFTGLQSIVTGFFPHLAAAGLAGSSIGHVLGGILPVSGCGGLLCLESLLVRLLGKQSRDEWSQQQHEEKDPQDEGIPGSRRLVLHPADYTSLLAHP